MPKQVEKLAILFADISGSTALYDTLGDQVARQLVARCLALMISKLAQHRGELVKTIGDEIMCIFPSSEAAMLAACDMQEAVDKDKPGDSTPMFIRIGFHYGEAIREDNDVYGDAVNVAARVTDVARARQIIATVAAVDALPQYCRGKARQIRRTAVKGKQEQLDIFQIAWQDDMDVTRVGMPVFVPQEVPARLLLRHSGQEFTVGVPARSAMLGRGDTCQIVVADDFASRQHARVELRNGKFVVCDQSINGTYIRFSDGQVLHSIHEEVLLRNSGSISLGRAFTEAAAKIIEFSIPATPA